MHLKFIIAVSTAGFSLPTVSFKPRSIFYQSRTTRDFGNVYQKGEIEKPQRGFKPGLRPVWL
jgi:hypothetical protein